MNIVQFTGGLGNQMFQYALMLRLNKLGHKSSADLSFYDSSNVRFELCDVFDNIDKNSLIKSDLEKETILSNLMEFCCKRKTYREKHVFVYDDKVFRSRNNYISGYWQSYKYLDGIYAELKEKFAFNIQEEYLNCLVDQFENDESTYISVHVRRGDYLHYSSTYGGICDEQYYDRAISVILESVDNPVFVFFSDDIEWTKANIVNNKIRYLFPDYRQCDNYRNWYDMYLMTRCHHNIIANSTFSWWGAMLNINPGRMVCCPSKWINQCKEDEIIPIDWLRI